MEGSSEYDIRRISGEGVRDERDRVASEVPLTVFVNDYELATLLCSPTQRKELAVGFLAGEGIVKSRETIREIRFSHEKTVVRIQLATELERPGLFGRRTLTSGCGRGVTFYNVLDCDRVQEIRSPCRVESSLLTGLMRDLQRKSPLFQQTGGTHAVALADTKGLLYTAEDIGRHNAVDKVLGSALLDSIDLQTSIILSSGRLSSEMTLKALKSGVPILASRSAPTGMAIRMAREKNLTLVGFVRGRRMNVYAGYERILCHGTTGDG